MYENSSRCCDTVIYLVHSQQKSQITQSFHLFKGRRRPTVASASQASTSTAKINSCYPAAEPTMAISLLEIKMLQDVLMTLASISTGTIQTLINLSQEQNHDDTTTHTLENEISRLKGSIEAANKLVTFYDQRLREERENGTIKRHMEEAKFLTASIRAIRRVQTSVETPLQPRRNTNHITAQPVSFEGKLSVRRDMLTELTTTESHSKNTAILQRATKYDDTMCAIEQRTPAAGNPLTTYNSELFVDICPFRQPRNRPSAASQEPTPSEPPLKAAILRHTRVGKRITQSPMALGLIRSASMPFRGRRQHPSMQSLTEGRPGVPHSASHSVNDSTSRLWENKTVQARLWGDTKA